MSHQAFSLAGKISHVLIIQTGDLPMVLRSLLALRAVKQNYPEIKFSFLTKSKNAAPVKRTECVDQVIELPEGLRSKEQIAPWLGTVLEQKFDLVANWSFNMSGAILASLIPTIVRLGQVQEVDDSVLDCDAWTMYWNGLSNGSVPQDIHFTDIFTTQLLTSLQIHLGEPSAENAKQPIRQVFRSVQQSLIPGWASRKQGIKWIVLNTSGWENQALGFVDQILRRHPEFGIVQIGETGPDFSTSVAQNFSDRYVFLVNKLNFDQVLTILSQTQWCVSLQQSVLDLSAMMGIRVMTCMNPKNLWGATGPYGNGHIILESESIPSSEVIHAAFSYGATDWLHGGKKDFSIHLEQLGVKQESAGIQFYRSRIRQGEEGGGVVYDRLQPSFTTLKEFSERVVSRTARAWFCGWVPPLELELKRFQVGEELLNQLVALKETIQVYRTLLDQGFSAASDLEQLSIGLKRPNLMDLETKTKIEDCGKKLAEIEILMIRTAMVHPALRGVTEFYRSLMKSLPGDGLAEMARQTKAAFSMIAEGISLIEEVQQKLSISGEASPANEKRRGHLRLVQSEV